MDLFTNLEDWRQNQLTLRGPYLGHRDLRYMVRAHFSLEAVRKVAPELKVGLFSDIAFSTSKGDS